MAIQKLRGVCPLEGCGWDGQLTVNGRMRTHRPPKDFTGHVGPSGNCGGGSDLPKPGSVYDADTKEPVEAVQELSAAEEMEQRVAQGPGPGPNPLRSPVAPGSTGPGETRELGPTHQYNDDHGGIWSHPGEVQNCWMPECAPTVEEFLAAEGVDLDAPVAEAPRNLHAEVIASLANRTPEQKLATAARMDRTAAEATGLPLDLTLQIQAQLAGVLTNADRAHILDGWGYDMTCGTCDRHEHVCPGCGTETRHNVRVCKSCDAFYSDDPAQTPLPTKAGLDSLAAGVTAAPEPSCVYPNGCAYPGEGCTGPCADRDRPDMGLMQTATPDDGHAHRYEYGDDGMFGHSGSFCVICHQEEPVQSAAVAEHSCGSCAAEGCTLCDGGPCCQACPACGEPLLNGGEIHRKCLRNAEEVAFSAIAPGDVTGAASSLLSLTPEPAPAAPQRPLSGSEAERFLGRVTGSSSGSELEDFLAGGDATPDAADFGRAPRWFKAKYDGECDMPGCGAYWDAGEQIRSDGRGGWQGYECCGWREEAPTPEEVTAAQELLDGTDLTPAESVDAEALLAADQEARRRAETARPRSGRPKTPMSGGRYVMPHPDNPAKAYRGTRVTNFENLPADKLQLKEWELRCVVAGLAARPELGLAAQGLDVKADKKRLNALADEAKNAAGAKDKASLGTRLHRYMEEFDTGQREISDMPEEYRADLWAYAHRLRDDGYRMLPHLVERTTGVPALSLMGTWDRVVQCPDGKYRIGDVKTGSLAYSQAEMCIQLKVYQMGANGIGYAEYGGEGDVRDWKNWVWKPLTDELGRPITVEDDYGLIFHLPPGDAVCTVWTAPFDVGATGVELADRIRAWQRQKQVFGKPDWSPDALPAEPVEAVVEEQEIDPETGVPVAVLAQVQTRYLEEAHQEAVSAAREEAEYQRMLAAARELIAEDTARRKAQQQEKLVITPEATETAMAALRDAGVPLDALVPATMDALIRPATEAGWPDPTKEDDVPKPRDWEAEWKSVASREAAAALYEEMRPHLQEIGQTTFNALVAMGQAALRERVQKTPA